MIAPDLAAYGTIDLETPATVGTAPGRGQPNQEVDMADRTYRNFWNRVAIPDEPGCWIWTGPRDRFGYGRCGRSGLAHRYAWECTVGPIPEGLKILHHCDNPPCVNPFHLYAGTPADNTRDGITRGRIKPPPPRVYLTNEERERICDLCRAGMYHRDIAKTVNRALATVQRVLKGAGL